MGLVVMGSVLDVSRDSSTKQFDTSNLFTSNVPDVHVYPKNPTMSRIINTKTMTIIMALEALASLGLSITVLWRFY
jgi:hypothetical protein